MCSPRAFLLSGRSRLRSAVDDAAVRRGPAGQAAEVGRAHGRELREALGQVVVLSDQTPSAGAAEEVAFAATGGGRSGCGGDTANVNRRSEERRKMKRGKKRGYLAEEKADASPAHFFYLDVTAAIRKRIAQRPSAGEGSRPR